MQAAQSIIHNVHHNYQWQMFRGTLQSIVKDCANSTLYIL